MDAWKIDPQGLLPAAQFIESPNRDARPQGTEISMVVIHNISLPPGQYGSNDVANLFCNHLDPQAHPYFANIYQNRVSTHFFIRRDGSLLEGCDTEAFGNGQYETLNQLLQALKHAYPIKDIIGHSDIAPGRKTDPGPCFDWKRIKTDQAC